MDNNFKSIMTSLQTIRKSINGYAIYRFNSNNKYKLNLNLINSQIEIKRNFCVLIALS